VEVGVGSLKEKCLTSLLGTRFGGCWGGIVEVVGVGLLGEFFLMKAVDLTFGNSLEVVGGSSFKERW
jgi:hypothetical protein